MNLKQKILSYGLPAVLVLTLLAVGIIIWSQTGKQNTVAPSYHILFIGNSYTSYNDLPKLVLEMTKSAGLNSPDIQAFNVAGATLKQHSENSGLLALISNGPQAGKKWDFVVMQEQSETPAFTQISKQLKDISLSGGTKLAEVIKAANPETRIILYETWARHADYWKIEDPQLRGYGQDPDEMQQRTHYYYEELRAAISADITDKVVVAHTGELWQQNYKSQNPIPLHRSDMSHPAFAGSYLAGLEIFSKLYNLAPEKVSYTGELSAEQAAQLKELAQNQFYAAKP